MSFKSTEAAERYMEERRASEYHALTRARIAEEASLGDKNTLDETIQSDIYVIGSLVKSDRDPGALDHEFHEFWHLFILAAQNYSADNPKQDTLLFHLLYAREIGILTHGPSKSSTGENATAQTSNGQRIWNDLPFFLHDFREAWASKDMSKVRRKNLASFIARVTAVGILGNVFAEFLLVLFRDALETPSENGIEVPIEDLLPAIDIWFCYASHKIGALVKTSFNEFDPDFSEPGLLARNSGIELNGFSPSRWEFWKTRLNEIRDYGQEGDCTEISSSILDMMDFVDGDHLL
jgi:hypothetical protein